MNIVHPKTVVEQQNNSLNSKSGIDSSSSSVDRYACFAEIQSQSSSIFDSFVDQLANSDNFSNVPGLNDTWNAATSKSLNNSLNGGFRSHHQNNQLSQSFNGTNSEFRMSSAAGKF